MRPSIISLSTMPASALAAMAWIGSQANPWPWGLLLVPVGGVAAVTAAHAAREIAITVADIAVGRRVAAEQDRSLSAPGAGHMPNVVWATRNPNGAEPPHRASATSRTTP